MCCNSCCTKHFSVFQVSAWPPAGRRLKVTWKAALCFFNPALAVSTAAAQPVSACYQGYVKNAGGRWCWITGQWGVLNVFISVRNTVLRWDRAGLLGKEERKIGAGVSASQSFRGSGASGFVPCPLWKETQSSFTSATRQTGVCITLQPHLAPE